MRSISSLLTIHYCPFTFHVMRSIYLILFFSCLLLSCHHSEKNKNYLFDLGSDKNRVEKDYTRVSINDEYTATKGYGWLRLPNHVFDSVNQKLSQSFLHDGVSDDSLSFRVDLPNGDYFMKLYLGMPPTDTTVAKVAVNEELLPDTISTPWYRIPYRTVFKRISIRDGRAVIRLFSLNRKRLGLYSIEFRPVTEKESITFATELEQDSIAVKTFAKKLEQRLISDSSDIGAANQLQSINDYLLACSYYNGGGWSWAVKKTGLSLIYRLYAAADLLEPISQDNTDPLRDKASYLLARIYYWLDQEDSNLYHSERFSYYFNILQEKYPNNILLQMYLGKKIFDPLSLDSTVRDAPRWALYERETVHRMQKLVHWWVNEKQSDNGEMGGKYGDDVELLRWWLPIVLGADDSIARKGYRRLADGVWKSDALERGFARHIDDVEHSAELFRDTHPAMFMINYGDPEYLERCLLSMQNFRDVWTGVTSRGHLHFRSYYLSATEVLAEPPYGIDVALNARALLPGLWATWYNQNPSLVKLFSAWSNAWVDDAKRNDNGKPTGILPSAIAFAGDRIGGDSKQWYDAHLTYDYYQWDHTGHVCELQNHLLGMYAITGNPNFLEPVNAYAKFMKLLPGEATRLQSGEQGSLDWARNLLINGGIDHEKRTNPMGKTFAFAQRATNTHAFDSLIIEYGSPYNRYQFTRDKSEIYQGFEELLSSLRYNFPMSTSEVKFTDRVYVPGSDLLMGMYTGHFGAGYEYPFLTATWENTGPDISIFVRKGDRTSTAISLYNFGAEKNIRMKTWQLAPGVYTLKQGIDRDDDDIIDEIVSEKTMELTERVNAIDLQIPSKKEIILELEQVKPFKTIKEGQTDLALNSNDIRIDNSRPLANNSVKVTCRVHNIGNSSAKNAAILFLVDDVEKGRTILGSLQAPNDLQPRMQEMNFDWVPTSGDHKITIRILSSQPEITKWNNEASRSVHIN